MECSSCDIPKDPPEQITKDIYSSKYYRDKNGQYISPLLRNPMHPVIGGSYGTAFRRFLQLEQRLCRAPEPYSAYEYIKFMRKYEDFGHVQVYSGHKTRKELTSLLNLGGFTLHKWVSSSNNILNKFSPNNNINFNDDLAHKIFGLERSPKNDSFCFKYSFNDTVYIKRHLLTCNFINIQFIGFCDASSRGYGACVYARSINNAGELKVQLLISKTKVSPIKPLSIPRLELMAAVLLSKLFLFVTNNFKEFNYEKYAFTDSSVVLAWLNTPPYKLKTFVSSRVSKVVELIPSSCWYHVTSENNAADICSRGAWPSQLASYAHEWLHGPQWLLNHVDQWPISRFYLKDDSDILELKSNIDSFALSSTINDNYENVFAKYSCFNHLNRVIGWCFRFYNNCKLIKTKRNYNRNLSYHELLNAHNSIIKCVQNIYFISEINNLKDKNNSNSLQFKKLSPFIDCDGFLRVGGRLSQSNLTFNRKHPLLLPKKCHIINLLVEYYNKRYLHVGPRTLRASQTFWKFWATDYLHTLQQRVKWHQSKNNIKIGDIVIIKSDLGKPLQWSIARVHQLHPGLDNHIRVVTLKTKTGYLKRPVNRLCPLPKA